MGSVVVARGLQSAGSVVVVHGLSCSTACGIFQTRNQTRVPCIGRRILNHCATREVRGMLLLMLIKGKGNAGSISASNCIVLDIPDTQIWFSLYPQLVNWVQRYLGAFFRVTADRRITEPDSELSGFHKIM